MMKLTKTSNFIALLFAVIFLGSCSISSHPNEKLIIGTWRPLSVEKIVDSSAIQAGAAQAGTSVKQKQGSARPAAEGGAGRKDAELNRLVQLEMRATMVIYPDKTAIKNFQGKPLHAKWKMKGKGTKIVAKNLENKTTFVIEILEINKEKVVIIEHAPVGDLKITYERVLDAN